MFTVLYCFELCLHGVLLCVMKNAIVLFLFLTQKNSVSFSKCDLHWH